MNDRRPMHRASEALDLPTIGLYAALASALVLVTLLGVAPLALAIGLLALLVVD